MSKDLFLEYAEVHGNFYGSHMNQVVSALEQQKISVLDIDI